MDHSTQDPATLPPRIGDFEIHKLLGEGTSGRVYLAEQDHPARTVALKTLLRLSEDQRRRFERETEVLASLEHSNIGRLYDAGETTLGDAPLAWMAMAYIEGQTLSDWAAETRPDTHTALRLVATLARAAHFAHTRGIVHRDLKPANVLIRRRDGVAEPVIVDFGVAHVAQGDSDNTVMTQAGQVLGTLPYMSWEQLTGEPVDARTDVYALGVMAYELIAGVLPYPGLSGSTLMGALDTLKRGEPKRLSAHVSSAAGDVETLVGTAMARDPDRRYASAAEFAADIERWLDQRPIEARRPTLGYTAGLFMRRHRAATVAAGLAVVALVAATVVSISFALSERQALNRAEAALAQRAAVTDFLSGMMTQADPANALGARLTVVSLLDTARAELAANADVPAAVRQQLSQTLGNTYAALGRTTEGVALLERAVALAEAEQGGDSLDALTAKRDLVAAQIRAGEDAAAEQTLGPLRQALSADPTDDAARAQALSELDLSVQALRGERLTDQGRFADAETVLRPAYERVLTELAPGDPVRTAVINALARTLQRNGQLEESAELSSALEASLVESLGETHPRTLAASEVVALSLRDSGDYAAALARFRDMLAVRESMLAPDHIDVASAQANLGATLAVAGQPKEGLPLMRTAYRTAQKQLGGNAELVRTFAGLLAYVASEAQDLETAERMYRTLIEQAEAKPDGPVIDDLPEYNNLGNLLVRTDREAEAVEVFETLMALAREIVGTDHLHYGLFQTNYGEALRRNGDFETAIPQLVEALTRNFGLLGNDHPFTRKADVSLDLAHKGKSGPRPDPEPQPQSEQEQDDG